MAAIKYGKKAVFGLAEPLPLEGFPEGKVRMKIRNDEFVKIRIKTQNGIREFVPTELDGKWIPACETARNQRQ